MGCAASKLELKEEALPPGLKPIHRRIEDAKKRMRHRRYQLIILQDEYCNNFLSFWVYYLSNNANCCFCLELF